MSIFGQIIRKFFKNFRWKYIGYLTHFMNNGALIQIFWLWLICIKYLKFPQLIELIEYNYFKIILNFLKKIFWITQKLLTIRNLFLELVFHHNYQLTTITLICFDFLNGLDMNKHYKITLLSKFNKFCVLTWKILTTRNILRITFRNRTMFQLIFWTRLSTRNILGLNAFSKYLSNFAFYTSTIHIILIKLNTYLSENNNSIFGTRFTKDLHFTDVFTISKLLILYIWAPNTKRTK